jgi:hypothetical protein
MAIFLVVTTLEKEMLTVMRMEMIWIAWRMKKALTLQEKQFSKPET